MKDWIEVFIANLKEQSARICAFLCIAVAMGLILTIIFFFLGDEIYNFYGKHIITETQELLPCEEKYIAKLIFEGKVSTVSDFFTGMMAYYDGLISILATLLGTFAFVSWFVNKLKLKNEIENIVQSHLDNDNSKRLMTEILKEVLDKNLKRTMEDSGLKDELRNETVQLVIDNIEKNKKEANEPLVLKEGE